MKVTPKTVGFSTKKPGKSTAIFMGDSQNRFDYASRSICVFSSFQSVLVSSPQQVCYAIA